MIKPESKEIIERAKASISTSTIENLFSVPAAYWKNGKYFTVSPLRNDNTVKETFAIMQVDGVWIYNDFASDDKGDIVDLIARSQNIGELEAACEIMGVDYNKDNAKAEFFASLGQSIHEPKQVKNLQKPEAKQAKRVESEKGVYDDTYKYFNDDGSLAFAIDRYKLKEGKRFIVWHFNEQNKQTFTLPEKFKEEKSRPLYNGTKIKDGYDFILVVEGEKKCKTANKYFNEKEINALCVSWSGGAKNKKFTDFSKLIGKKCVLWPDNDDIGKVVMNELKFNVIKENCYIVCVDMLKEKDDIDDLIKNGEDPMPYIEKSMKDIPEKKEQDENDSAYRDSEGFSLLTQPSGDWLIPSEFIEFTKNGINVKKGNKLNLAMLEADMAWKKFVIYDEGISQPVFSKKFSSIDEVREMIWERYASYGIDISIPIQNSLLSKLIRSDSRNSLLDFYEGLKPYYSEIDPLDEMLGYFNFQKYGVLSNEHEPETDKKILEVYREAFRLMLLRQCARIYAFYKMGGQEITCDIVPTFRGNQGIGKGRFCRWLAIENRFFADLGNTAYKLGDVNFIRTIRGKLIGELGEMSKMRAAEVDDIKAFISGTSDVIVPKFKEGEVKIPRTCSFIASTNEIDFLKDRSGNRRFVPIWLYDITPDLFENQDLAKRLWAYYWEKAIEILKRDKRELFKTDILAGATSEKMRTDVIDITPTATLIESEIIEIEKELFKLDGYVVKIDPKEVHLRIAKKFKAPPSLLAEIKHALLGFGYTGKVVKIGQSSVRGFIIEKTNENLLKRVNSIQSYSEPDKPDPLYEDDHAY